MSTDRHNSKEVTLLFSLQIDEQMRITGISIIGEPMGFWAWKKLKCVQSWKSQWYCNVFWTGPCLLGLIEIEFWKYQHTDYVTVILQIVTRLEKICAISTTEFFFLLETTYVFREEWCIMYLHSYSTTSNRIVFVTCFEQLNFR